MRTGLMDGREEKRVLHAGTRQTASKSHGGQQEIAIQ